VVLILGSSALINHHSSEAGLKRKVPETVAVAPTDLRAIEAKAGAIRNLIKAGNIEKAEDLTKAMIETYPYTGESYMLMGDVLMRKQDPVGAVLKYREAVDLNPDYLDKKTPLFQGKKLKSAVGEALETVNKRIEEDNGNEELKQLRKDIYYMMRKIAGSCG